MICVYLTVPRVYLFKAAERVTFADKLGNRSLVQGACKKYNSKQLILYKHKYYNYHFLQQQIKDSRSAHKLSKK